MMMMIPTTRPAAAEPEPYDAGLATDKDSNHPFTTGTLHTPFVLMPVHVESLLAEEHEELV